VDDWRRAVKEKLDGLEGIYGIASDRFTVSWERRARLIELAAWYVLLLGSGRPAGAGLPRPRPMTCGYFPGRGTARTVIRLDGH
jgi:hypothetical protein